MTYEETVQYLYASVPVFQHQGAGAYKPGLERSKALDDHLNHPHTAYQTIHVAGTNGKGSVCHLLAAILQESGYTVGLYTSPHLVDFRERIRVNGKKISKTYVVDFVERTRDFFEPLKPSFFELTSTMALDYFRFKQVDFAIIETGLGGRLDSTNIITPIISIITNVSLDHQKFLGETVKEIATEKAGIMKPGVPVIVGEVDSTDVLDVLEERADLVEAPMYWIGNQDVMQESYLMTTGEWYFSSSDYGQLFGQLSGVVQARNANVVLTTLRLLENMDVKTTATAVRKGFEHVIELTGLHGRWEQVQEKPCVICDTGHNEGAWIFLRKHLDAEMKHRGQARLHMIIGMANDKDVENILSLMPEKAFYYFTQASVERAMPVEELTGYAVLAGLSGMVCDTVEEAVKKALAEAGERDLVFIGGSTFVVADALPLFPGYDA
ncbi:MAG: bifunctional folylpolyglutamate synthase/dihydrofolate synthase [Tannerellaceae bacterium]|nr:bifunctional folylpolyglutamate synthase/dihydrofolate synthase [Tannerellaceae bacterium]